MEKKTFCSGFASVVGRPNVGKSTLINYFLGQKIAAVSPRPQTTIRNQLGILTTDTYQLIFIDTPGIHKPLSKLGEGMNDAAASTLTDVDCVLWMVDVTAAPTDEDRNVAERLRNAGIRENGILVLNKKDQISPAGAEKNRSEYQSLFPVIDSFLISSRMGEG